MGYMTNRNFKSARGMCVWVVGWVLCHTVIGWNAEGWNAELVNSISPALK